MEWNEFNFVKRVTKAVSSSSCSCSSDLFVGPVLLVFANNNLIVLFLGYANPAALGLFFEQPKAVVLVFLAENDDDDDGTKYSPDDR